MSLLPSLGEIEQILIQLESSTVIQKFYSRKRPEKKKLTLRRETRQVWKFSIVTYLISTTNKLYFQVTWGASSGSRSNYEGAVELREVKEIRWGKSSKDFEKWPEESKKMEMKKCFVVFYGTEFKLRSLSVVALSEREAGIWVKGLKYLVSDINHSSYPLQVERWLRKEFYAMENSNKT